MRSPGHAVVTGATRGIGDEICRQLVGRFDRVIGLARKPAIEPVTGVDYIKCDVTDETEVDTTFGSIGPVSALVNNAGTSTSSPVARTTLDDWDSTMAVNATAVFLCTRAVLGSMIDAGAGTVVTVASTASLEGFPYLAAYGASKHAALGFMRVLSAEVAGKGVVAATVCPTYVRTPMTEANIKDIAARTHCSLAEAEQKLAALTPHGRLLEVGEVATAVVRLIERGTNGDVVVLDGGPD